MTTFLRLSWVYFSFLEDINKKAKLPITFPQQFPVPWGTWLWELSRLCTFCLFACWAVWLEAAAALQWKLPATSWVRQELCAQAAALGWRRCWKHPSTGWLQMCTYICNAVSWFWLGWSSFPLAAHIVLCSPYLAGTALILHECFVCALMLRKLSPLPQG